MAVAASLADRPRAARRRESGRLPCAIELVPPVSCPARRARLDRSCRARSGADPAPHAGRKLVVADLAESYPARTALFAQLAARGTAIEEVTAPPATGTRARPLADAADELRAAFAWAKRHLDGEPRARVAVVVPAAARRHDEIERGGRRARRAVPHAWWAEGRSLAHDPTIGAARDALALAGTHAPYAVFGRWLRSPFFVAAGAEPFARARLDAELRGELRSQLSFQAAYRCGVKELLEQRAPESARALAAALAAIGDSRRATPSRWAHLASRFLADLGWQARRIGRRCSAGKPRLDELARLTPIIGEISLDSALAELARLTERATAAALPVRGVHVLRPHRRRRPGLRRRLGHGFHRYGVARAAARQSAAAGRVATRARHAVLVAERCARALHAGARPARASQPRPRRELARARLRLRDGTEPRDRRVAGARRRRARRADAATRSSRRAARNAGGRRAALRRRARGRRHRRARPSGALPSARVLPRPPRRPVARAALARRAGTLARHRDAPCGRSVVRRRAAQSVLPAGRATSHASVERALARLFGRARGYLAAFYGLEADLLQRVLTGLLHAECVASAVPRARRRAVRRRHSRSAGLQRAHRSNRRARRRHVSDHRLQNRRPRHECRSGSRRACAMRKFRSTRRNPAKNVRAAVVARLAPAGTRLLRVLARRRFPRTIEQRCTSRYQSAARDLAHPTSRALATEFAAGDTRIFVDDYDEAAGEYAPLTRLFEQLGLARGTVRRW